MKIAIFGTTGAGKSTLITKLVEHLLPHEYIVYRENFDQCPYFSESLSNKPIDGRDFNYKLDIWMLTDRMKLLKKAVNQKNVIFDRGVLDSGIFADAHFKDGRTHKRDYETFSNYFKEFVLPIVLNKDEVLSYDLIVYLRVDPQTAIKRIKKRGREEEQLVNPEFWRCLTDTYEQWYQDLKDRVDFLVVDGNSDHPSLVVKDLINQLKKYQ